MPYIPKANAKQCLEADCDRFEPCNRPGCELVLRAAAFGRSAPAGLDLRIAEVLAEPDPCRCAPGIGRVGANGIARCDDCGRVMVASTLAELIRGEVDRLHRCTSHIHDRARGADVRCELDREHTGPHFAVIRGDRVHWTIPDGCTINIPLVMHAPTVDPSTDHGTRCMTLTELVDVGERVAAAGETVTCPVCRSLLDQPLGVIRVTAGPALGFRCPACRVDVDQGAARCPGCNQRLDWFHGSAEPAEALAPWATLDPAVCPRCGCVTNGAPVHACIPREEG